MKTLLITLMILFSSVTNAADAVSYGSFKMNLEEGVSTQRDVISLYGSPDNMMMDSNGEIWVYDRVSSVKESSNKSNSSGSYGSIIIAGGSTSDINSTNVTKSSTKTITAILEFNLKGILTKVSVRTSKY